MFDRFIHEVPVSGEHWNRLKQETKRLDTSNYRSNEDLIFAIWFREETGTDLIVVPNHGVAEEGFADSRISKAIPYDFFFEAEDEAQAVVIKLCFF